jgi:hypothetical protein
LRKILLCSLLLKTRFPLGKCWAPAI